VGAGSILAGGFLVFVLTWRTLWQSAQSTKTQHPKKSASAVWKSKQAGMITTERIAPAKGTTTHIQSQLLAFVASDPKNANDLTEVNQCT
jgi:hypothetical protein